ncbi:MAG: glycosyltransferase [Crocinitomicaceae bacterium]
MFLFWLVCFSFYCTCIAIIGLRQLRSRKIQYSNTKRSIAVIVPVRNEKDNVLNLVNSLRELKYSPQRLLFVDDSSSDNTVEILKRHDQEVHVLKDKTGKKEALKEGVNLVSSEYVLFTDADCVFPKTYEKLFDTNHTLEGDIIVLPVWIKNKSILLNQLIRLDFAQLQALTFGLRGSLGNGANLLVKRESFEKFSKGLEISILSGDDYFLLKEAKKNDGRIVYCFDPDLTILTDAPLNLKELISQRSRWIKKSFQKGGLAEIGASFIWILFSMTPYILIFNWLHSNDFWPLLFLLLKMFIDAWLIIPVLDSNKNLRLLYLLPLLEFLYPFYYLSVVIRIGFKNTWKGRDL